MYNPNKFVYQPMQRVEVEGKRRYLTPDGEKLPSVTTILDATKSEESKKALHEWRKRVGVQRAQEITTEAAGRGTRMHKWLEDYIKTGILNEPGSNPYSSQSHSMAKSIIEATSICHCVAKIIELLFLATKGIRTGQSLLWHGRQEKS
jgi:genome maintenance exonuclease 1